MRNHAAQLAIIKQLSRQELRSTTGNCHPDDRQDPAAQLAIVKLMTGRNRAAQLAIVKQMSRQ